MSLAGPEPYDGPDDTIEIFTKDEVDKKTAAYYFFGLAWGFVGGLLMSVVFR